ncbi:MFS transporter [Mitsuokella sp. oral taxon 131]|uniref:MFS transporter n=1 Tax=Mitsuokella sp. oral taxon 131 TaxID=1321780 RepID=UPI0003AE7D8E|nr:MFS transporter [Mitsuokella sp. oral taxon 131]ERL04679.1 transporter, major facilitator family protein [Mitsuokella sp. oral taxon 131 str. W9106]
MKKTNFRWVILAVIFTTYLINYADRSNIGVALPFIKDEFHMTNTEMGGIASMFFLGYAISQIPAGFILSKLGIRGTVSLSIIAFSLFTFLMGHVQNAGQLVLTRLGLGLGEGPTPVGLTSTINNWFPAKEKATAVGVYIASTLVAPIIVPSIVVWIALNYGWRNIFIFFAIPGFFMAVIWYLVIRTSPRDHGHVNQAEVDYIESGSDAGEEKKETFKSFGLLDKIIRLKHVEPVTSKAKVFTNWNIIGNTLGYFFMVSVVYGIMTWIPSYLVDAKGYTFTKMGFMAAAPFIGGLIGSLLGGYISDKVLGKRRKPTMLFTALFTFFMMFVMMNLPNSDTAMGMALFATGFCLNLGWPAFTAYPMGITDKQTYPIAIAVVNSGGNLGGAFSPFFVGLLLDWWGSYDYVFAFFGIISVLGFLLFLSIDEPIADSKAQA